MNVRHAFSGLLSLVLLAAGVAPHAEELQPLRIADNQRMFVREDGTPFFWLGDTAWSIFNQATPGQVDAYLDDRAAKDFTVIQGCIVLWNGLYHANPDGELPFIDGDPARINEAFFANVDAIIAKAEARGLYMAILPVWIKGFIQNNRERHESTMLNPEKMRVYARFLGERYGDRPIIWVLGGDWPGRDTVELSRAMAEGLMEGAGEHAGRMLITYHPTGRQSSSFWFHDEPWLDFNIIQSGHFIETTNFQLVADDYAKTPVKPTLDSEPGYENITDRLVRDNPNARRIGADDVRRAAYLAVFAGAAGHTYGNGEVYEFWDASQRRSLPGWAAGLPFEESLQLPGASQMRYLRRLIESRPMLKRIPDQSLIAGEAGDRATRRVQATRADDGSYAFVYSATPGPLQIDLSKLAGERLWVWEYRPATRDALLRGQIERTDGVREFARSTDFHGDRDDWVLVLDEATDQPVPAPGARHL